MLGSVSKCAHNILKHYVIMWIVLNQEYKSSYRTKPRTPPEMISQSIAKVNSIKSREQITKVIKNLCAMCVHRAGFL